MTHPDRAALHQAIMNFAKSYSEGKEKVVEHPKYTELCIAMDKYDFEHEGYWKNRFKQDGGFNGSTWE